MLTIIKQLLGLPGVGTITIENRERFFLRVGKCFSKYDPRYALIEKAYNDAKDAFRNIYREGGDRYFEHVRAVALIVMDYLRVTDHEVIIAAILHDIVEDKPEWTLARVAAEYGQRVAMLVDYLSKPPKELFGGDKGRRDIEYHKKFHFAPREFFLIKLPDRLHNLVTLWDCAESKRERKITETELFYLPFAEQHGILIHELEGSIRELREASAVLA